MQIFAETIADPGRFVAARDEAQNLTQWLARMSRSFGTSRDGTPHEALSWNGESKMLSTPEIAEDTVLHLRLPDLLLHFSVHGEAVPHPIAVDGKSSAEVEAWLLVEMLHRGFDRDRFKKDLPYRWPKLMSGDERKYSPESLFEELRTLTTYFEDASKILAQVRDRLAERRGRAWQIGEGDRTLANLDIGPETFDIGFSLHPTVGGPTSHALQVGFAAGDESDPIPRFFVRPIAADGRDRPGDTFKLPITQIRDQEMSGSKVVDALFDEITR